MVVAEVPPGDGLYGWMGKEHGVEANDFLCLKRFAFGRRRPEFALRRPRAGAGHDRRLGKMQWHAEPSKALAHFPNGFRCPRSSMHVALNPNDIVQTLLLIVSQLLDHALVKRIGAVVIDQQRRLRTAGSSVLEALSREQNLPHVLPHGGVPRRFL